MLVLTTWPSMENFEGNSGSGNLSLSVLEGNSSQFTADNLKITKTGANEYTVQAADAEGEVRRSAYRFICGAPIHLRATTTLLQQMMTDRVSTTLTAMVTAAAMPL